MAVYTGVQYFFRANNQILQRQNHFKKYDYNNAELTGTTGICINDILKYAEQQYTNFGVTVQYV